MLNTVHGRSLRVCQWTGETIHGVHYKIPQKGLKEFRGCYSSPSVCVSAMIEYAEKASLSAEETHELLDMFQASLRRVDGQEGTKFTIQPAGSWKNLQAWGGHMSLEEYHKTYEHDIQTTMFFQSFPAGVIQATADAELREESKLKDPSAPSSSSATVPMDAKGEFEYDSDPDRPPNAPKRWRVNHFNPSPSQSEPQEKRLAMPRCISSCLEFFKEVWPGKTALVVYLDPHSDKAFGVGLPEDWMGKGNRRASDTLGKTPVYGTVELYHKNKLRLKKRGKEEMDK